MKSIFFLFLILPFIKLKAQQSVLFGEVSIQNSKYLTGKKQFVINAQVQDIKRLANLQLTDHKGAFNLILIGIEDNREVTLSVKKKGFEVVNLDALRAVTGQNDTIKIWMASPKYIADFREKLYKIGKTNAQIKIEKLLKENIAKLAVFEKNSQYNKEQIAFLKKENDYLQNKLGKIEDIANELIRKYAPINLDDASVDFKRAFQLFQKGSLDSALTILNSVTDPDKVTKLLNERLRVNSLKTEIEKRYISLQQSIIDKKNELNLKADIYYTQNNLDSSDFYFRLLVRLDILDGDNLFSYAHYLQTLNRWDSSIKYYSLALNGILQNHNRILVLNNLGLNYIQIHQFEKAKPVFKEALERAENSDKTNIYGYILDIARTQHNLGILYDHINDFAGAKNAYLQAYNRYMQVSTISNPLVSDPAPTIIDHMASLLNNLGLLYYKNRDYPAAEGYFQMAFKLAMSLKKANLEISKELVTMINYNLALVYFEKGMYNKVISLLVQTIDSCKLLIHNNPNRYESNLAKMELCLGKANEAVGYIEIADTCFKMSVNLRRILVTFYSTSYLGDLANSLYFLGRLHLYHTNQITKSKQELLESLYIRDSLSKFQPEIYEPSLAESEVIVGALFNRLSDSINTEIHFKKGIEIQERLAHSNIIFEAPFLISIQNKFAAFYSYHKNFTQCISILKSAVGVCHMLQAHDVSSPSFWPTGD